MEELLSSFLMSVASLQTRTVPFVCIQKGFPYHTDMSLLYSGIMGHVRVSRLCGRIVTLNIMVINVITTIFKHEIPLSFASITLKIG